MLIKLQYLLGHKERPWFSRMQLMISYMLGRPHEKNQCKKKKKSNRLLCFINALNACFFPPLFPTPSVWSTGTNVTLLVWYLLSLCSQGCWGRRQLSCHQETNNLIGTKATPDGAHGGWKVQAWLLSLLLPSSLLSVFSPQTFSMI